MLIADLLADPGPVTKVLCASVSLSTDISGRVVGREPSRWAGQMFATPPPGGRGGNPEKSQGSEAPLGSDRTVIPLVAGEKRRLFSRVDCEVPGVMRLPEWPVLQPCHQHEYGPSTHKASVFPSMK